MARAASTKASSQLESQIFATTAPAPRSGPCHEEDNGRGRAPPTLRTGEQSGLHLRLVAEIFEGLLGRLGIRGATAESQPARPSSDALLVEVPAYPQQPQSKSVSIDDSIETRGFVNIPRQWQSRSVPVRTNRVIPRG